MNYQFHPLADVLPLTEGLDYDRLVASVRELGLLNPITLHDGRILDGRNRYRACQATGVDPVYVPFTGDDPVAFVIAQNLERRHLGPSERAMVGARPPTLRQARPKKNRQICRSSIARAGLPACWCKRTLS